MVQLRLSMVRVLVPVMRIPISVVRLQVSLLQSVRPVPLRQQLLLSQWLLRAERQPISVVWPPTERQPAVAPIWDLRTTLNSERCQSARELDRLRYGSRRHLWLPTRSKLCFALTGGFRAPLLTGLLAPAQRRLCPAACGRVCCAAEWRLCPTPNVDGWGRIPRWRWSTPIRRLWRTPLKASRGGS